MARLIHGMVVSPAPRRGDPLTDLTLLLSRLQRTILHADAEREARLRESEFEREKAHANISYARSLLAKLEQDNLAIKFHPGRQDIHADLARKRDLLDQLSERLNDLAEFAAAAAASADTSGASAWADGDEDTSDGEDILAEIIATPSESLDSSARSPEILPQESQPLLVPRQSRSNSTADPLEPPSQSPSEKEEHQPPTQLPEPTQQPSESASTSAPPTPPTPPPTTTTTATTTTSPPLPPQATTTTTSQTLRARQPHHPSSTTTTSSTPTPTPPPAPTATTTATSLFPAPSSSSKKEEDPAVISTTEAILDHHRAQHDMLSESILKLASELKASSHAFSASLDQDRELVERAGRGIERTGEQMRAVGQKMGAIQRMAEEEGWLGRMKLYAMVYGLMLVLVLVVFVLPKLRF